MFQFQIHLQDFKQVIFPKGRIPRRHLKHFRKGLFSARTVSIIDCLHTFRLISPPQKPLRGKDFPSSKPWYQEETTCSQPVPIIIVTNDHVRLGISFCEQRFPDNPYRSLSERVLLVGLVCWRLMKVLF